MFSSVVDSRDLFGKPTVLKDVKLAWKRNKAGASVKESQRRITSNDATLNCSNRKESHRSQYNYQDARNKTCCGSLRQGKQWYKWWRRGQREKSKCQYYWGRTGLEYVWSWFGAFYTFNGARNTTIVTAIVINPTERRFKLRNWPRHIRQRGKERQGCQTRL